MGNQPRWSERIATNVRRAIKASGYTEHKIANLAGIPKSTFDRRVRGVNPWTTDELEAVADALEIDPNDLIPQTGRNRS